MVWQLRITTNTKSPGNDPGVFCVMYKEVTRAVTSDRLYFNDDEHWYERIITTRSAPCVNG